MDDVVASMDASRDCLYVTERNQQLTRRVADLSRRNQVLRRQVQILRARDRKQQSIIARLEEQLREVQGPARPTAKNSSVPPSANPPGAAKPVVKKPTGRRIGAQLGHKGHGRRLLPAKQVDHVVEHRPSECEHCQAKLPLLAKAQVESRCQVVELRPHPVEITEHQAMACPCPQCGWISLGKIPGSILRSVCGPRLSAVMGYLSATAHVSRRATQQILKSVLGVELSLGSICAREKELAEALAVPYQQLKEEVRQAAVKYVDETGWKRAAQWLWVAATMRAVVFLCAHTRTYVVLWQLLGKVPLGVICSDRYGVYDKYPKKRRGLCWSHLQRDFQRCLDRGGESGKIGQEALAITREVFHRWRWFRRGRISRATLQRQLRPLRRQMRRLLQRGAASGLHKTAGLCRRLLKLQGAMWRFAEVEGLEPTNNLAERMLRIAVIWRKVCFGSHSRHGCRFVERMLSVTVSLKLRKRNVLDYLAAAVAAHREGRPAPALN